METDSGNMNKYKCDSRHDEENPIKLIMLQISVKKFVSAQAKHWVGGCKFDIHEATEKG